MWFDAAGVSFVPANSDEELDSVCWNRDVWALIDDYPLDGFGDPRMYSWMFLWTASPNKHETSTVTAPAVMPRHSAEPRGARVVRCAASNVDRLGPGVSPGL